jgi:hypothetical protein
VVASEVRNLAGRSAEAAREIKQLIGASVEKVESGARLVQNAGTTMDEIVGSVQRVGDIIGEITAAASEQSEGISQVNTAVNQLDQMTQQNAALVEQSAAAAQSMRDQAQRLSGAVQVFKLGDGSSTMRAVGTARHTAIAAPQGDGIDLDQAIQAHAEWRSRLRTAAQNQDTLDADTIARDDCCDLGRWLHGSAGAQYGNRPSFVALLDRHRTFHAIAGQIAGHINRGAYAEAEEALSGNTPFSRASSEVGAAIVRLRTELQAGR